jgi:Putative MetA-pathway of phenol degradation
MLRWALIGSGIVSLLLANPAAAAAQSAPPLSSLLPTLYQRVIDEEGQIFSGFSGNSAEIIRRARLDTASQIGNLISSQLSSFPLVSSAGGFTWTFEPSSATFTRASDSFGPLFAERATTIGRNRLNFGVNYQRVTFDHLEGKSLSDREIVGYTGFPGYLGGDSGVFYEDSLELVANTDTVSVFATYGASDRLDIGVAIPINHVEMSATLTSRYGDSIVGIWAPPMCDRRSFGEHCFPPPIVRQESRSASGIGDIVARAKYNFLRQGGGGLSGAVDVRLPTGDEENLLGVAGLQAKMYFIASTTVGRLSPHINAGYTFSGESGAAGAPGSIPGPPPDEINYVGGADYVVSLRTTAVFDVVGRTLRGIGTLQEGNTAFGRPSGGLYQDLRLVPGADLNLLLGSAGVRMNPAANLLVSGNVLFPLTKHGLTDSLTWLVGFDYSF